MRFYLFTLCIFFTLSLQAHCQMPCGIYHDQMIYDRVNEYYETMYKANMALKNNKLQTAEDYNQFVRWVMTKDHESDDIANLLCNYFLMQKIKPGEEETADLIASIHKLLHLAVGIKQTVGMNCVNDFGKEWDHFKFLFHPEIECKPVLKKEGKEEHDHSHDHAEGIGHHAISLAIKNRNV